MTIYTDKNKDSQNSMAVKDPAKNSMQSLRINDNRPEAIQQKKLINNITGSPLMIAQRKTVQRIFGTTVQKEGIKEEEIQKKSMGVHQLEDLEEEKLKQGKFKDTSTNPMAPVQKKENTTGLPDNLKTGVENLSGMSLDHVKVHYSSAKPAQLNALAYAQGSDIHVGSGQEKHLPHEAWHVVQQMQGRVQPTVQMEGVSINDDVALETEADVMGAKALS